MLAQNRLNHILELFIMVVAPPRVQRAVTAAALLAWPVGLSRGRGLVFWAQWLHGRVEWPLAAA